ncbi:MAG: hypothetical protein HKN16_00455 [Saprospiraceae bacterium]|nr:hypothetical protein [Saprospiraceae bacterium]
MRRLAALLFLATLIACTPKVVEEIAAPDEPPPPPPPPVNQAGLSPCQNWNGLRNQEELMTAHVLYKDNLRLISAYEEKEDFEMAAPLVSEAFAQWKKVFDQAPAADGRRPDHFQDGIYFFDRFYLESEDNGKKQIYVDSIKTLYLQMAECYGDEGFVYGSMGYDFYYRYEGSMDEKEIYNIYKRSMDAYGDKPSDFVIPPFTALLVNGVVNEEIPSDEARKYVERIQMGLEKGIAGCEEKGTCLDWQTINEDVGTRLGYLESVKGFYDQDYYKKKYLFQDLNFQDCDQLSSVIGRLRWGGCSLDDPDLKPLIDAYKNNCYKASEPAVTCRSLLQDGDPKGAADCYLEKAEATSDAEKQAQFYLVVAKIYYGEIKRYSLARQYALKAAKAKQNWGDPYMLIGKLYASSGPLCGPGRGWDSQIVTWPAIDMWTKAKKVDPSVTAEANQLINRYAQFMPAIEQIFQRGYEVGQNFKIPCWIQTTTVIRAGK